MPDPTDPIPLSQISNQDPMANPMAFFNGTQWAIVEKLRAADQQSIHRLRQRIMELEGCLVFNRNFLPSPLKLQAEAILWPQPSQPNPDKESEP